MLAFSLLLAMLAPDDGLADQIAHCGIARDQITTRYEDMLQDETATIATPGPALTAPQLKCLVALTMSGRIFAFTDPAAQARFDPLLRASGRQAAQREARQWLADHGLLGKLPAYDPARQSLADFGVSLEALCGIPPGTRLRAFNADTLSFIPPANLDLDDASVTAFSCIVSATMGSNLEERGVTVGFIGNEQAGGPQPNP